MRDSRTGRLALLFVAATLTACLATGPSKDEVEAAKKTVDCQHADERILIRFDDGEVRLLMPDATKVFLYQIPAASGFRYLNGDMELRGRSLEMELLRNGVPAKLQCKPYELPAKPDK
jgi:hypothetical protein